MWVGINNKMYNFDRVFSVELSHRYEHDDPEKTGWYRSINICYNDYENDLPDHEFPEKDAERVYMRIQKFVAGKNSDFLNVSSV